MQRSFILTLSSLLLACGLTAEAAPVKRQTKRNNVPAAVKVAENYADSLAASKARIDSLMAAVDTLDADDQTIDSRMYKLLTPLNFYHSTVGSKLSLNGQSGDTLVDNALMHAYMNRPTAVASTDTQLSEYMEQGEGVGDVKRPTEYVDLKSQIAKTETAKDASSVANDLIDAPVDMFVAKPSFWTFSGDYYLQFMQNYVTENWYKGGSNNYSLLGTATLQYNYNNKQKVKWNNKLEMKLGFQNTESDTINNFKAVEDLLRFTSNIGLQAHKKWYYTAQVILNTQFAQGRKNNQTTVFSDFMSPFNLSVSLGMDYTVATKNNKLKGNIHIAPLAYNLKYVDRLALATSFGLEEGHHTLHDYGSQLVAELDWTPFDQFKWHTRFYAYTTYEKFQMEWENTLTFKFNKYISTNVFLYPRFDDSAARKDGYSYWQFKEYLSFGFTYSM